MCNDGIMVRITEYGNLAEKKVFSYLKKTNKDVFLHGTKGYHFPFGDIQVGKNIETCKIYEVKGQSEDNNSKTKWDVPRKSIKISTTEYKFLKNFPNRFFICIVYRLKYNKNPKWNIPKMAICKGIDLVKLKPKRRAVHLITPNDYWKKSRQVLVK